MTLVSDNNIQTLSEIIVKLQTPQVATKKTKEQYIPYNKSILTRILAPTLQTGKVSVLNHLTKHSLMNYFQKRFDNMGGLFQLIEKIYGEKRLQKRKISE